MPKSLSVRLSIMMFLNYVIWQCLKKGLLDRASKYFESMKLSPSSYPDDTTYAIFIRDAVRRGDLQRVARSLHRSPPV